MDEKIHSLFVKRMELILDKRKNDAAVAAMQVRIARPTNTHERRAAHPDAMKHEIPKVEICCARRAKLVP